MKKSALPILAAGLLIGAGLGLEASGRSKEEDLAATVLSLDTKFWQAYNSCETAAFAQFFVDDVEFYHDKSGMTEGAEALIESLRRGVCDGDTRLRREAVADTVRVHPLQKDDAPYGAIVSGDHRFYVREDGKPERLDGLARFMNLWLLQDGTWKMSRVLSYDHGPAPYVSTRERITLSDAELDAFVGSYEAPNSGAMKVQRAEGGLVLSAENGRMAPLNLYPESDHVFFVRERDLTFEFVREDGKVTMRVREQGAVVEEVVRRD